MRNDGGRIGVQLIGIEAYVCDSLDWQGWILNSWSSRFFFLPEFYFQPLLSKPAEEKELRRIEAETARLEQQNDTALAKFLADDWVCFGARTLSKKEFIENVKSNLDSHENGVNPYTIEKKQCKSTFWRHGGRDSHQGIPPDTGYDEILAEEDTDVFTRDASGWHLRFTKISPPSVSSSSPN